MRKKFIEWWKFIFDAWNSEECFYCKEWFPRGQTVLVRLVENESCVPLCEECTDKLYHPFTKGRDDRNSKSTTTKG